MKNIKLITIALATVLALTAFASGATAQQSSQDLRTALDNLTRALSNDQSLAPATRNALNDLTQALGTELDQRAEAERQQKAETRAQLQTIRAASATAAAASGAAASENLTAFDRVLDRLDVYGDLRLRYEQDFFETAGRSDRIRGRLRARIGANFRVFDDVVIGGRLRTGDQQDPNSPYVNFDNGFDNFDISFDRAFAKWTPSEALPGFAATAGKFSHPIERNPVYGELVWDEDVSPDGVVFEYKSGEVGPLSYIRAIGGLYVAGENANAQDIILGAFQVSTEADITDGIVARGSAAYYEYGDPQAGGAQDFIMENQGNALINGGTEFASDFSVLNMIGSVTFTELAVPVTLSAEFIHNFRAFSDQDTGWALGIAAGGTSKPGDYKVYYQYQDIQQESIFSAVAGDDFLQQTNYRGHVFGGSVRLTDAILLNIWNLVSEPISGSGDDDLFWRFRTDITFSF